MILKYKYSSALLVQIWCNTLRDSIHHIKRCAISLNAIKNQRNARIFPAFLFSFTFLAVCAAEPARVGLKSFHRLGYFPRFLWHG